MGQKTNTIVSNESAEIMRMFHSAFNDLTGNQEDYYLENLQAEIDTVNEFVYPNVNIMVSTKLASPLVKVFMRKK